MASAISAFTYSRQLNINTTATGANLSENLTDFPVCVRIYSSSWSSSTERGHFFDASNTNGKRIQFFADDGTTNLAYLVDTYDSGNQKALYWVKVSSIAANTTTHIHVAYGNDPNSTDQDQPTSVWDSSTRAVWLFNEGSGTTLTNRQGNTRFNATISGATYGTASLLGRSLGFDGTDDYAYVPTHTDLDQASINVEALVMGDAYHQYGRSIVGRLYRDGYYADPYWCWSLLREGYGATPNPVTTSNYHSVTTSGFGACGSTTTRAAGTWALAWTSHNASTNAMRTAYDRDTAGAATRTGNLRSPGSGGAVISFGSTRSNVLTYTDQHLAFVRLSDAARSASWNQASSVNMLGTNFPGDGWLTWGSETSSVTFIPRTIIIS
jgi:hypothetical protein